MRKGDNGDDSPDEKEKSGDIFATKGGEGIHSVSLARDGEAIDTLFENNLIVTLVNLGRATKDNKTILNAATALAHITEVLHCNDTVASP